MTNKEHTLDSIDRIKETCIEVDKEITAALVILKEMKAKYPATFRAHEIDEVETILRRGRSKLR